MKTTPVDPRMSASRRAAVARLIARGLVECGLQRGTWKLTKPAVKVCKGLWPEILPWSKWELAAAIAQRKTTQYYLDDHPAISGRRRRPRKAPKSSLQREVKAVLKSPLCEADNVSNPVTLMPLPIY